MTDEQVLVEGVSLIAFIVFVGPSILLILLGIIPIFELRAQDRREAVRRRAALQAGAQDGE